MGYCRWLPTCASWLGCADVDPEWRLEKVRRRSVALHAAFAVLSLVNNAQSFLNKGDSSEFQVVTLLFALLLATSAVLLNFLPNAWH